MTGYMARMTLARSRGSGRGRGEPYLACLGGGKNADIGESLLLRVTRTSVTMFTAPYLSASGSGDVVQTLVCEWLTSA